MMKQQTPAEVLKDFAESLPTTIAEPIWASCCMAFGRFEVGQDYLAAFKSILDEAKGVQLAYRVAAACGAMELALYRGEVDEEELYRRLAAEHSSTLFKEFELRAPLREKHWQLSLERFAELRATHLSALALRRWMAQLPMPTIRREPPQP